MFGNIAIASNASQLFNPLILPNLPQCGIVLRKITVCYKAKTKPLKSHLQYPFSPPSGRNL